MQSIILISAFICGNNKEGTDIRLFEVDASKYKMRKGSSNKEQKAGANLLGKTRRFGIDRLMAVADYLASLECEGANECRRVNHSAEYLACINSLV